MKKTVFFILFCAFVYHINAQCTIDPFIQQNYDIDAKILALREIRSNVNDADYDNPFVPDARVTPYLEKLSAIYNNPQNLPEIDSLFNEFQFRVNPIYSYSEPVSYKTMIFSVNTDVSWVQTLKDTGVSGVTDLDNLINQYQFSIANFIDLNSSGTTAFLLDTSYDFLNIRALTDDFEAISNINYAEADVGFASDPIGINYTGIPYNIILPVLPFGTQSYSVGVCDIIVDTNGIYQFWLYGGDCFAGCQASEIRYVSISSDCNTVNFARTLSNEEFQLADIAVYPNPASNTLNIQGIDNIQMIEIHSITGQKVQASVLDSQIDVSALESGIYFLKLTDDQNRSAIQKFIKQ